MFKLVYFVPAAQLEQTKQAVFGVGAGRLGNYEHCAWQTLGVGQFKPCEGSQPFIGQQGELEQVEEYRVEVLVDPACIQQAVAALKAAHPYEEPAYEVIKLEAF